MTRMTTKGCSNNELAQSFGVDSAAEAIKAFTIGGAYQYHEEDITGSIEVGKSAELVILDRDLEATPVDEIYATKVVETVFKGRTVYGG